MFNKIEAFCDLDIFIASAVPSDSGQYWPNYAMAKLVVTPTKMITLNGLLLSIYMLERFRMFRIKNN
jgi:hypothetical protein